MESFERFNLTTMADPETRKEVLTYLSRVPLFAGLATPQQLTVIDAMEARVYQPGERIFEQGSLGHELHILLEGAVDLMRREPDGRESLVTTAKPGTAFGEIGFLTGATRALSAVNGETPSLHLILSRSAFDRVVAMNPDIGFVVMQDILRLISIRTARLPPAVRNWMLWGYEPSPP